jgi:hypothetical protein
VDVFWVFSFECVSLFQNVLVLGSDAINALLELAWLSALSGTNVFYSNTGWGNVWVLGALRNLVVVRHGKHGFVHCSLLLFVNECTLHFLLDNTLHGVGHHIGHRIEQLELKLVLLLA